MPAGELRMRLYWLASSRVLMGPFDSDRGGAADGAEDGSALRRSYVGVGGSGRINCVLVEPKARGCHAAMLYPRGVGQSMW